MGLDSGYIVVLAGLGTFVIMEILTAFTTAGCAGERYAAEAAENTAEGKIF